MSTEQLLETIDESMQEVEEQLLREFYRIRNLVSDTPFEPIDTGVKNSLGGVVEELKGSLEHSGDNEELALQTPRHENLFARMAVIRELLKARVPTAYLHEIHHDISSTRSNLESRVVAHRKQGTGEPEKKGFFNSLKGMFAGNQTEHEVARNRVRITAQEERQHGPAEVYLDNGIYSASRELAMLAHRVAVARESGEDLTKDAGKEKAKQEAARGKATFTSRDVSRQMPDTPESPRKEIARTPEEIRRKLEHANIKASGASHFEARDVDQPRERARTTYHIATEKHDKQRRNIAQSPDAIRQKLEKRQKKIDTAGKASFNVRDVEPLLEKKSPPRDPFARKPIQGKAVFGDANDKAVFDGAGGKASFGARDIEPPAEKKSPPPDPFARKPTEGKAVFGDSDEGDKASFGARDIEPLAEKKPPPPDPFAKKPTKGKAVFESRDLSKPAPKSRR